MAMDKAIKPVWSAWRKANYTFYKARLSDLPNSLKLVDLGAGDLPSEDLFLRFDYLGVDFQKFPHVSLVTDLTKDIPLPDRSADIITLSNTVEHIPNTEHLFQECKRLLKPGGVMFGTVPFLLGIHQDPYDFNRYTTFALERFLKNAGFSDIKVEPLGSTVDAYNTIELKTFDQLRILRGGFLVELVRFIRRVEMRIIRKLFSRLPSTKKITEGYAFSAKAA